MSHTSHGPRHRPTRRPRRRRPPALPARPSLPDPSPLAALLLSALLMASASLAAPEAVLGQGGGGTPSAGGDRTGDDPASHLRRGGVQVSVLAGALAPLSRLSEESEAFSTELAASGLFALDGLYWIHPRVGVGLRAAYAPATLSVVPGALAGAVPEDLGPADYWSVSAEARLRFPSPAQGIDLTPYLAAGGGIRRLDVRALAGPEVVDATDPLVTLAAGAGLPLVGPAQLQVELREHLTLYRTPTGVDRLQNDLAILVGGSVRLR